MTSPPPKIQLFHTCLVNDFFPDVGMSIVHIFRRISIDVAVPSQQTCCGQPMFNAGFHNETKKAARYTLDMLNNTHGGPIIIPSGSCSDMITHHYRLLFQDDPHYLSIVTSVTNRCFEFTQFMVDELGTTDLGAQLTARIAYHPSCHLMRGMGIKKQPMALLEKVNGLEIVDFDEHEECCGFGGSFAAKNPGISGSMLNKKLKNIRNSGAEMIVSCDMGCLMHLEGGIHRQGHSLQIRHVAQVLSSGLPK